ncbi:MAG: hypothetical protein ACRD22_03550 [Terriglobia bacterium]
MGRVLHLETNSLAVLEQIRHYLDGYHRSPSERPHFAWRIICEDGSASEPTWPEMTAFSEEGLSYAGVGHRGFLAVDRQEREAVGFLPEELARNTSGFGRPFLATLFSLTSRAMELTAIRAASVARGGAGLLIFGPSNSGKTVSSFLASRLGLEFHADQAVFLEANTDGLRAWGEFWPTLFYEGAEAFLPELPAITKRFHCQGRTCFHLEKLAPATGSRSVSPVACVFLERHNSGRHRLIPLQSDEFRKCLHEHGRLWDDASSQCERSTAWNLLGSLPAYHLSYGGDPSIPARLFQRLIEGDES